MDIDNTAIGTPTVDNSIPQIINVVAVKHESCGTTYLYQLPSDKKVRAGDMVRVRTNKGTLSNAICLCDSYYITNDGDSYNMILKAFGAHEPLSSVIGRYELTRY